MKSKVNIIVLNFLFAVGLGIMLVNFVGLVLTTDLTMILLHLTYLVVGILICLIVWQK